MLWGLLRRLLPFLIVSGGVSFTVFHPQLEQAAQRAQPFVTVIGNDVQQLHQHFTAYLNVVNRDDAAAALHLSQIEGDIARLQANAMAMLHAATGATVPVDPNTPIRDQIPFVSEALDMHAQQMDALLQAQQDALREYRGQ